MAYQVSVFLENKPGHFRKVTSVLKDEGINIRTMTLATTTFGWGVLNLVVDQPEKACEKLKNADLSAALREIVVLEMLDKPGGLDEMLKVLDEAGINMENAYGRIVDEGERAFLVIDVEDVHQVEEKLTSMGIEPLPDDKVYGI
jgi:hypothetical protein